jgi:ribosomal protein L31E
LLPFEDFSLSLEKKKKKKKKKKSIFFFFFFFSVVCVVIVKCNQHSAYKKRAPRAIKAIKKFASKEMGTKDVRIDVGLNEVRQSSSWHKRDTRISRFFVSVFSVFAYFFFVDSLSKGGLGVVACVALAAPSSCAFGAQVERE